MNFDSFKLSPPILKAVAELGYQTPTPIQQQGIPVVLEGRDVLGLAQTGTGKTAAFMLPILERIKDRPRGKTLALVIAPTRELAEQINVATKEMAKHLKIQTVTIYGGVALRPQVEKLRRGVEIIVACPGRLLDHLRQRTLRLDSVETLVLDEADQMFDMGFLPNIKQIIKALPTVRQNLLFSATMPKDIRKLAEEILQDPVQIEIGRTAPTEMVAHALYPVEAHLKTALLRELLSRTPAESVLVFTRTKHRAKKLALTLAKHGIETASLQGNLSQNRRQEALSGFRSGKYQVLVATDIAARGIDVSSISHVINYDIPETVEAYTHRIGRTGRAARTGDAFTFISHEDNWKVRSIEKVLGKPIERRQLEGFDYSARPAESAVEFARDPREGRGNSGRGRPSRGASSRTGSSRGGSSREGYSSGRSGGDNRRSDSPRSESPRANSAGSDAQSGEFQRRAAPRSEGPRGDSYRSDSERRGSGQRGSERRDSGRTGPRSDDSRSGFGRGRSSAGSSDLRSSRRLASDSERPADGASRDFRREPGSSERPSRYSDGSAPRGGRPSSRPGGQRRFGQGRPGPAGGRSSGPGGRYGDHPAPTRRDDLREREQF